VLLLVALATACGGTETRLGGGPDVNVCGGYVALDKLPEPRLDRRQEVEQYLDGVLRVLDRVDYLARYVGSDGKKHQPPASMKDELAPLEDVIHRFRTQLKAMPGQDGARQLAEKIAADPEYRRLTGDWARFYRDNCQR
jgi:hypothetical protein